MRHLKGYTPLRYILTVAALTVCQACTPTPGISKSNAVAQAYNQSNVVKIPPYTRSIINTTNF